jgi:hypothetical protein
MNRIEELWNVDDGYEDTFADLILETIDIVSSKSSMETTKPTRNRMIMWSSCKNP